MDASQLFVKPTNRRNFLTTTWLGTAASFMFAWPRVLVAQSAGQGDEAVRVGDRWTYDTRDEITGSPGDTYTYLVTEVSPTEIVTRVSTRGKTSTGIVVFDHDWNRLENAAITFKPNDGQGIRLPFAVGKEWRSEFETRNRQTGASSKVTSKSKITAEEMITTPAGTFATFKIEAQRREVSSADPSKYWESQNVAWYAPQINHWVRRTFLTRILKRTTTNTSEELVDFGRKL